MGKNIGANNQMEDEQIDFFSIPLGIVTFYAELFEWRLNYHIHG